MKGRPCEIVLAANRAGTTRAPRSTAAVGLISRSGTTARQVSIKFTSSRHLSCRRDAGVDWRVLRRYLGGLRGDPRGLAEPGETTQNFQRIHPRITLGER